MTPPSLGSSSNSTYPATSTKTASSTPPTTFCGATPKAKPAQVSSQMADNNQVVDQSDYNLWQHQLRPIIATPGEHNCRLGRRICLTQ